MARRGVGFIACWSESSAASSLRLDLLPECLCEASVVGTGGQSVCLNMTESQTSVPAFGQGSPADAPFQRAEHNVIAVLKPI